ncbi:alpha-hydroxy-acid oxidizing protein [Sphingomonas sp. A2-49]|uniref:alpha-hydroxy-acid oxidizing protein n=1 Tax=Sphingomonas sp. A2-49 TaxID=1391375 RepID=UPI0021D0A93E|nr:alpha-hydroxy-acid oxidizing protein [Sphingomonas sp. A2-49]MCU6454465.1 alpha-hydroxy-acid oxidizing protein [Sphingomonas sp. A2-49]
MPHYGDYQNAIYGAGLSGVLPKLPVDFATLERRATAAMPKAVLDYVQGGCGDEATQDRNAAAFRHWGMVPRMMVDCTTRDLSIDLLGLTLPHPLFMAPIGVNGICTQDGHGDLAAARAAADTGVPFMASTLANDPLEAVAAAMGDTPGFFQLYTPRDRDLAASLVSRAEAAGYKGIVVTLDTWVTGWRPRDLNTASFPQLRGAVLTNYFSDPVFRAMLAKPPEADPAAAIRQWMGVFGKVLTWDDMPWLRSLTRLPLILKGICHPDDARRAVDTGADAIYCSNHGGRQANGGIAAIDMLPGVVAAAGTTPVLFDSGVRSGSDAVKALALGARAVGIGRPYAYGLALDGAAGAAHVLRCILAEADLLMAVNGYPDIAAVRAAGATRHP